MRERPSQAPEVVANLDELKQNLETAWTEVEAHQDAARASRVLPFLEDQIVTVTKTNPEHPDLGLLQEYYSKFRKMTVLGNTDFANRGLLGTVADLFTNKTKDIEWDTSGEAVFYEKDGAVHINMNEGCFAFLKDSKNQALFDKNLLEHTGTNATEMVSYLNQHKTTLQSGQLPDWPKYIPPVQNITKGEAMALIKTPNPDRFIHQVEGAKKPSLPSEHPKEYIFYHGLAGGDAALIETGYSSANFAYGILRNGTIIQFFEPNLGQGAIGGYGMINGDPMANMKGIGIEFSAEVIPGSNPAEVQDPTPAQLAAAKRLTESLQARFNIPDQNLSTSAQAVTRNGVMLDGQDVGGDIHTDTYTWLKKPHILEGLGLDPDLLARQDDQKPSRAAVQERIDYSLAILDNPKYAEYHAKSRQFIDYWLAVRIGLE